MRRDRRVPDVNHSVFGFATGCAARVAMLCGEDVGNNYSEDLGKLIFVTGGFFALCVMMYSFEYKYPEMTFFLFLGLHVHLAFPVIESLLNTLAPGV
ncbi:MAG: hypothetical protein K0U29_01905 [Gammaproteobacteria bacterium]|nr:hypothetical protein [Gammaproteobacteria bacterium]MCH9743664.1 hypothetical protein [Gammaproteobacteria bacterium]